MLRASLNSKKVRVGFACGTYYDIESMSETDISALLSENNISIAEIPDTETVLRAYEARILK